MSGTHLESENHPWTINVGDHAKRADSPGYVRSRALMVKLVKLSPDVQSVYGPPPYQDHHGGGVWLRDAKGWQLVLGLYGCEWSLQFCADPTKIDAWRLRTKRLVDAFPETVEGYESLGYQDGRGLLDETIATPQGVAEWVDSIFNASVPLPAEAHTGTPPSGHGVHHFPKPIKDGDFLRRDDFVMWVTDPEGKPAAVAPVAPRGSGDSRVRVAYATPGTKLAKRHAAAHGRGDAVILSARHPMARSAFRRQES